MKYSILFLWVATIQLFSQDRNVVSYNNEITPIREGESVLSIVNNEAELHQNNGASLQGNMAANSPVAQGKKKRYLVTPHQEVIPIDEETSASAILQARVRDAERARNAACSGSVFDGWTISKFQTPYSNFGAKHKDVMGQWFVANSSGNIDTIFWQALGLVGAKDSLLYLRVHRSVIGPKFGPGARPGPYNPPCQNWGYWNNTNDLDRGIAAFPEDATDTTWISTIAGNTPSRPPFAEELWGLGGFPTKHHPGNATEPLGRLNFVALAEQPTPLFVTAGDQFFISFRVNSPATHVVDDRTEFLTGQGNRDEGYQDLYPSPNWKFYEHDSGPSNCAGIPTELVKRGWVARGGFSNDTTDVAAFLFWFSLTTIDNVPPELLSSEPLGITISTDPRLVSVELQDCDYSDPTEAGIDEALISYTTYSFADHSESSGAAPMTDIGGNIWEGEIPAFPAWTQVSYSIVATDTKGLTSTFPQGTYLIAELENNFFLTEVHDSCAMVDISTTGTEIPSTAFFAPPDEDIRNPKDDGTAGPFFLGNPFYLFGEEYNYAWVGVNGAIALSKTAAETLDVNANGHYTTGFTFPDNILPHNNMRDSVDDGYFPAPFIAGLWGDYWYGDTAGSPGPPQWGHILYKNDGCKFIVQWDSLGVFGSDPIEDRVNLIRIILNTCDGTISFQYDDIGNAGIDTMALVGVQADTIDNLGDAPWIYVNKNGYPVETRPKNGRCIRLIQTSATHVNDKWNMVTVSRYPLDNNYSVEHLFPSAVSPAFQYVGNGFQPVDTVEPGKCYWIKFNGSQIVGYPGVPITDTCIDVVPGWNMIGGISCLVPTSSIDDANVAGASWFGYDNGYRQVTTLTPGHCYWVKASGAGTVCLECGPPSAAPAKQETVIDGLANFNKFVITANSDDEQTLYLGEQEQLKKTLAAYELPPLPLQGVFDARFASQRMVEVFAEENSGYTIKIQSPSYPVRFAWDISSTNGRTLTLKHGSGDKLHPVVMRGKGSISITDPNVTGVKIEVSGEQLLPEKFELMQNYPNPFNPITVFSFQLPVSGYVTLKIYNVLGQEIATVLDGMQNAGYQRVEWDAKEFPSGVYLYRLVTETFTDEKRMVIIK
ncbi:MAG: T9SS type A sorting domain-containing protein [Bacteroidetes bacterium]|nr:MAG: T9SS type A sorting domain-containing protein [Bacteroidota bacterium]